MDVRFQAQRGPKLPSNMGAEALSNCNNLAEPGPNSGLSPSTIVDDKPIPHPTMQVQDSMALTSARGEPSISTEDSVDV